MELIIFAILIFFVVLYLGIFIHPLFLFLILLLILIAAFERRGPRRPLY